MQTDAPARHVAGEGLLHPIALAAIVVLVLNDHVLKHAFPGAVTGKLSDVAGMIFFPLFLQAAFEIVHARIRPGSWRPSRRVLLIATIATAAVFAAIKLSPAAGDAYRIALGLLQWPWHAFVAGLAGEAPPSPVRVALVQDATDLIALPFVLLAFRMETSHENAFAS